jgi:serine/threonine protein kinase
MASVYVGRLSGMAGFQRLVAIKIIHAHLARETAFVEMFLDEARLAAGIHHPNVGEILEVGEDDGLLFMVGELVMGQSLAEVFRRAGQMGVKVSNDTSAWMISRVCLGLHAAHELQDHTGKSLKLVHRDVSPKNILISYNGSVKLIDFGVAQAQGRLSHTDAGTLKGKIGYMPPEQIMGEKVDRRGDLFSLGVVLYKIVTGVAPFRGGSDGERIHKILQGNFLRPRKVAPEMDGLLEDIILRAMATKPDERFPSAAHMNSDLESYLRTRTASVGSLQMADLMNEMFEEDIFEFQYRLQTKTAESTDAGQDDLSMPGRSATAGIGKSEPSTAAGTPAAIEHGTIRTKRSSGLGLGIGIAGVLLAVAAIAWVVIPKGSDQDKEVPAVAPPVAVLEPKVEEKVPVVEEEKPPSKITLDIVPKNAVISVDGKIVEKGTTELSFPVDGRMHELKASAVGYLDDNVAFISDRDQTVKVSLKRVWKKKKKLELKGSPYG